MKAKQVDVLTGKNTVLSNSVKSTGSKYACIVSYENTMPDHGD